MKKSKLFVGLVGACLLLAGCGETPAGSSSKAPAGSSSKAPASSQKASSSKHDHTFDETKWESNETQHWHPATCEHTTQKGSAANHTWVDDTSKTSVPATCQQEGVKYEKCSVCGYAKETKLPKADHDWEVKETIAKVDGVSSGYTINQCKVCKVVDVSVDAMSWTTIDGSNKDSSGKTLKFGSNGNYAEYKFNLSGTLTGDLYLHGWVDYWKDGSNNNDQRGFTSRKSGEGFNLEIEVNGTLVEITNLGTYEESGLTDGDGSTGEGNSAFGLVKVGAANLKDGENVIKYTRIESYNLNIDSIDFIGELKGGAAAPDKDGKVMLDDPVTNGLLEADGKFKKGGSLAVTFVMAKAGLYDLAMKVKTGSGAESQKLSVRAITFAVNGGEAAEPLYNDKTSAELGMSTAFAEVVLTQVTLVQGTNTIVIAIGSNANYRLLMDVNDAYIKLTEGVDPNDHSAEAYKATFNGLENCKLYEYITGNGYQEDPTIEPILVDGNVIWSRSKEDGSFAKDQVEEGGTKPVAQWNFKIVPDSGYCVVSITPDTANYKNLKTPEDLELANTYSVTQVKGNVVFTVVIGEIPA